MLYDEEFNVSHFYEKMNLKKQHFGMLVILERLGILGMSQSMHDESLNTRIQKSYWL